MPDLETIKTIAAIICAAITIYIFFTSRSKKNSEQLSEHEARITALENELKHLPTKDGQHRLELGMTEIAKTLEITRITVLRMEEALLARSDK